MSERVLMIVEDDGATRRALGMLFGRRGWRVCPAAGVAEGLGLLDGGLVPDSLILDLMLPDGSGELVLERVRALDLKTTVVVCTGLHDPARLRRVRALKPGGVLSKPVDFERLTALCESSN